MTNREAATDWGGAVRASHKSRRWVDWSKYNALCFGHHHVIIRPGVISSFAAIPGRAYAPPRPPVHYDDTPSYDDPSKFGG